MQELGQMKQSRVMRALGLQQTAQNGQHLQVVILNPTITSIAESVSSVCICKTLYS